MKYLLILLTSTFLFAACKTPKDGTDSVVTSNVENTTDTTAMIPKPKRPYQLKAQIGDITKRTDAYTISSARIEGNTLYIDITFSGGCAWHKFELIGSPAVAKSLPPQRAIKLIHDNDNDSCESLVHETIEADIRELADSPTSGSEIVLILDGYTKKLNYIFE